MRYPIVIQKDPDSEYGVTVPDLPGCFSAGETLDEALHNASEAIGCHLEARMLDGEAIPMPGSIDQHRNDLSFEGAHGRWWM
jgi:predicted RNase H-like HicB family nuclease